jgi:hypothetical protein
MATTKMKTGRVKICHILKMKQQAMSAASQDAMPSDRKNHKM